MAIVTSKKVIDLTQIATNLLNFIQTYGGDYLNWAAGGVGPENYRKLYTNASGRLATDFPSLMILAQRADTDVSGDQLDAAVQLIFEGTISGTDPDALVAETKLYARALESMLVNITSDVITAGSMKYQKAFPVELETELDILRGTQSPSAFLQIFQTRVVYRILTSGF